MHLGHADAEVDGHGGVQHPLCWTPEPVVEEHVALRPQAPPRRTKNADASVHRPCHTCSPVPQASGRGCGGWFVMSH